MSNVVILGNHLPTREREEKHRALKQQIQSRLEQCFRAYNNQFKIFDASQLRGKKLRFSYCTQYESSKVDLEIQAITIDENGLRFHTTHWRDSKKSYPLRWNMHTDLWQLISNSSPLSIPVFVTLPEFDSRRVA